MLPGPVGLQFQQALPELFVQREFPAAGQFAAMVQAGEVQNAAHHPGEPPGAVQNLLGILTLFRRGDVRFPQQYRIALNGGERRLELMGYPGNEVLPQGFHRPQFLHHGVEVPGDLPHLQNGAVGVAPDGGILRRGNTGRGGGNSPGNQSGSR